MKATDLVFLHSGLIGLGKLEGATPTITQAFAEVLSQGILLIPTFTYSWCNGQEFDPCATQCGPDVGGYSQAAWKDPRFRRSCDPNFSVAALTNASNQAEVEAILTVGNSCFGKGSVFDHMYAATQKRDGFIILLGGAHSDEVLRTTFIHYLEEKCSVPSRYLKEFTDPKDRSRHVRQLVRFTSLDEYRAVTGRPQAPYTFPIRSDYSRLGRDLLQRGMVVRKNFGYSQTRMVRVREFCDFVEQQLKKSPDYFVR